MAMHTVETPPARVYIGTDGTRNAYVACVPYDHETWETNHIMFPHGMATPLALSTYMGIFRNVLTTAGCVVIME